MLINAHRKLDVLGLRSSSFGILFYCIDSKGCSQQQVGWIMALVSFTIFSLTFNGAARIVVTARERSQSEWPSGFHHHLQMHACIVGPYIWCFLQWFAVRPQIQICWLLKNTHFMWITPWLWRVTNREVLTLKVLGDYSAILGQLLNLTEFSKSKSIWAW